MKQMSRSAVLAVLPWFLVSPPGFAQEVLPRPEPKFNGTIGRTYKESRMDKIPVVHAPPGAPNVLVVLIDDAGFGAWSAFGGQIPTPHLERLAQSGLRYTRFHTTALCSPTRAALLTGRNHHSAASGCITELGDSYPGYTGQVPKSCAMISEILRQNGYSTAFIGKNHNIPDWETSVSGPFDRWPILQGFDHFYGFIGGEASQWVPLLHDGNRPVEMEIPRGREADYTLNVHLADKAIDYIRQQKSVSPDRPFFMYYAPGATHAPHHVPRAWLEKFKGQFDQGWDRYREETLERQIHLGIVPPGTKLTSRPPEIPAWDSLSREKKIVAARLMEAFAAFTAETDHEIARVIEAIEEVGQSDNTLILYVVGDNGASMEGTINGVFNEMCAMNGQGEDPGFLLKHLDDIGGPKSHNHYPVGWAWAMDTPFQWGKQLASHLGGVRNPLVISWPRRIKDHGAVRTQFHHIIDITPTILEATGVKEPTMVNGVAQKPIEGVSMVYSFDQPDAPSARTTQYFEMFGNRALYHDGWIATCRHGRLPWSVSNSPDFSRDVWQLYHLDEDFSEADDLSAHFPERLTALQDLFWIEAEKYNVLPLDDRFVERGDPRWRPSLIEGRTRFTYYPGAKHIPESSSPLVKNRSFTFTAHVDIPAGGADGVLVAAGGDTAGYALYVKEGRPVFEYNYFMQERYKIAAREKLPPGACAIHFEFKYDGWGFARGGTGTIFVNGVKAAEGRIARTVLGRFSAGETFDTGLDTGSPVSDAYQSPFPFQGKLKRVDFDISPARLTAQAERELRQAYRDFLISSD